MAERLTHETVKMLAEEMCTGSSWTVLDVSSAPKAPRTSEWSVEFKRESGETKRVAFQAPDVVETKGDFAAMCEVLAGAIRFEDDEDAEMVEQVRELLGEDHAAILGED